jgi:hypothetical protein
MRIGRTRHGARPQPEMRGTTACAPMELAKRYCYHSLTHSGRTLHFLVKRVGGDRIMGGSVQPCDMPDHEPICGVNALLGPTQEDIDGMCGGSAAALLN